MLPLLLALGAGVASSAAAPLPILAAESVYANIAVQVAGADAAVDAVLRNPQTDPHAFEPTPSTARRVAQARIVIENGIGYDTWMDRLLAASPAPGRIVIAIAALLHRQPGQNDHLWYDPAAMPALQVALCTTLAPLVPDRAALARRCGALAASLAALQSRVAALKTRFAGTPVAATEPVLGNLLAALGLTDGDTRFQIATMNGTEPRATDIARLEDDLRTRRVRLLVTNAQATTSAADRLKTLAAAQGIPIVSVSETLPPGQTYQAWISSELAALKAALASTAPTAPATAPLASAP